MGWIYRADPYYRIEPEDSRFFRTGRRRYTLPNGLKPLAKHKSDFSVVQNTYHQFSNQGHRGSTFFLTGANPNANPGKTFSNTISVDQVAAEAWGEGNCFTSMRFEGPPKGTFLCNLWLTLSRAGGIDAESFGDSNGVIGDLMV